MKETMDAFVKLVFWGAIYIAMLGASLAIPVMIFLALWKYVFGG